MLIDPTFSALLFDVLNVNLDETRTSAAGPLTLLLITRSPLATSIWIVYDLDSGRPCTSREPIARYTDLMLKRNNQLKQNAALEEALHET